jgi:hypothetical protein
LPQHFLNLYPLPQGHGLFLPTFGFILTYVSDFSQQLELLQQECSVLIFCFLNMVWFKKTKVT